MRATLPLFFAIESMTRSSSFTTTVTSCPDPECQKILNKQMEKERVARETLVGLNKLPVNSFGRKRKDIILKKRVSVL